MLQHLQNLRPEKWSGPEDRDALGSALGDLEDADAELTFSITNNTNVALFSETSVTLDAPCRLPNATDTLRLVRRA